MLRHGKAVGVRRRRYRDSKLLRRLQINIVHADTVFADDFKIRRAFHKLPRDRKDPHKKCLGILYFFRQLCFPRTVAER